MHHLFRLYQGSNKEYKILGIDIDRSSIDEQVCMHACMYVCVHACFYVSMCTQHACICLDIGVHGSNMEEQVCMHACMYACMHAFM